MNTSAKRYLAELKLRSKKTPQLQHTRKVTHKLSWGLKKSLYHSRRGKSTD